MRGRLALCPRLVLLEVEACGRIVLPIKVLREKLRDFPVPLRGLGRVGEGLLPIRPSSLCRFRLVSLRLSGRVSKELSDVERSKEAGLVRVSAGDDDPDLLVEAHTSPSNARASCRSSFPCLRVRCIPSADCCPWFPSLTHRFPKHLVRRYLSFGLWQVREDRSSHSYILSNPSGPF